jgi:hypothetical protein
VNTVLWFCGFALMLLSFTFLLGGGQEQPDQPRISVEPWWPEPPRKPK